ncbi:CoA transferase [Mesorhizobium sp. CAU 1741]|uniref:CaiB/BaiF CoA transferase family protein n=1 Tax=Mesorhizobium sp. CAU 1741 TaxID=3140366 RepID=UPI00325C08FE
MTTQDSRALPLAGVRVLDLGQFIAVPFCTLWMAWLGAEVIVVESGGRMTARGAPPFAPGHYGNPDASGYFNSLYAGKKSCALDLTSDAGRDVARRLATVCDVMVDNFSTGVMDKLGLGYEAMSALNPRLIALSNGAFGRSGPMKNTRGLHSTVNLFSGVADVTGYVDGAPRIHGGVLPDPLSGIFGHFAVLTALHERERSGKGQYIDLAMYEAMLTLIPEAIIDFTMNGNEPRRVGNRDRKKAPYGIYRCAGDDKWIAISVQNDRMWASFCKAIGRADLCEDGRYTSAAGRVDDVVEIDRLVEAWTREQSVDAAADLLQKAGVAAGPVLRCDELLTNEQLQARGMIVAPPHPVAGTFPQLGLPWRMDSLQADYRRAPLLGEHTHEIITGLLGMSQGEFDAMNAAGVLN